ncbi:MAG: glycoside hydrolase family 6 protein [Byssovorax sp.]
MNTHRIFTSLSHGSLVALLLASLAPLGCMAPTDGADEDPSAEDDAVTGKASPLAGRKFFVDDENVATEKTKQAYAQHEYTRAHLLEKISNHAQGVWFGDWNKTIKHDVSAVVSRRGATVPILVTYNIPGRDCGDYSDGGAADTAAYHMWINGFAAGIGNAEVVVILEPDALWMTVGKKCAAVKNNLGTLKYAVHALKKQAHARVYIDAGMAGAPGDIANGLEQAGVSEADGFALNTSDSYSNSSSASRGHDISDALGGKVHFVIDTSRNGTGRAKDQNISNPWCNPKGLGLGKVSTGTTGLDRVDAFLWIKRPGQSDGECGRNNPAAGQWFETRAEEMAKNAAF